MITFKCHQKYKNKISTLKKWLTFTSTLINYPHILGTSISILLLKQVALLNNQDVIFFFCFPRSISTTGTKNDAWLSKIFVRKIEPTKESHSRMLSDKEIIYSLQTHNYRPDSKVAYLQNV